MASINSRFVSRTYQTDIRDLNAGLGLGSGDDFLSPRIIGDFGTTFTGGVRPIGGNDPFTRNRPMLIGRNPSPAEVLVRTNDFAYGIPTQNSNNPFGLYRLPNEPFPYFQGVPALGNNPDASRVLSASTQFQSELVTEGAPAIPGYPAFKFNTGTEAIDFMGQTQAFISSAVPHHPLSGGQGAFYPAVINDGGVIGNYYAPPPIMPYFNGGPFAPTDYTKFLPYPTPVFPPPVVFPPYHPGHPQPPSQPDPMALATQFRTNPFKLPNFVPSNVPGGITGFIQDFNKATEAKRVKIRQDLANPTTVNAQLLNSTGITGTGGKYGQGKVSNPFRSDNFLTDTNPFERFGTGMFVTNGNDNGKVRGTPVSDFINGTQARNNIIDGRGGEDNIIGSSKKDLVNIHAGDRVFMDEGDDLGFFDFTTARSSRRLTVVDGGKGNDILVLTVDDPSQDDVPTFNKLIDGQTSVSYNGVQILTRNIEKFIVIDKQGNIGGTYKAV